MANIRVAGKAGTIQQSYTKKKKKNYNSNGLQGYKYIQNT